MYEGRQEVEWDRAAWIAANVKATVSRKGVSLEDMNLWRRRGRDSSPASLDAWRADAEARLPGRLTEAEKWARWKEYCNAGNE